MSKNFDPYYEWLGIPPKDQPPNHYRLLGIELFESNMNVIERAADRQMSHVRTFQTGKHARDSQDLLNRLSAAKVCLLQPEKKAAYDDQLRSERFPRDSQASMSSIEIPLTELARLMPAALSPTPPSPVASPPVPVVNEIVTVVEKPRRKSSKTANPAVGIGIAAALFTLLGGAALIFVLMTRNSSTNSPGPANPDAPAGSNAPVPALSGAGPAEASPDTPSSPPDGAAGAGRSPMPPSVADQASTPANPPVVSADPAPPRMEMTSYNEVDQPPVDPEPQESWPPPGDALRAQFTNAKGQLEEKLAFCQTMSPPEFLSVVAPLRELGYRPIRVRPYVTGGAVQFASIWTRDALPWRLVTGVSRDDLQRVHGQMESTGFWPVDISAVAGPRELYTGLWVQKTPAVPARILLGISEEEFKQQLGSASSSGFGLHSLTRVAGEQGEARINCIFYRPSPLLPWFQFFGTPGVFANQISRGLPIDIAQFRVRDKIGMAAILLTDDKRVFAISHGGSVDDHLQQCGEFVRRGLIPLSISVIQRAEDGMPEGASVWVDPAVGVFPEFKAGMSTSVASIPSPAVEPIPRDAKLPTPSPAQIEAAIAKSREVLNSKFSTNSSPIKQVTFSAELLASAREELDPANKYALFLLARDVAVEAGDAWGAVRALEGLDRAFDGDIWTLRTETFDKLVPKSRNDVSRRALAEAALGMFQEAVVAEEFDAATKLLTPARRFRDLSRVVAARTRSLPAIRRLAESADQAERTLAQTPDDPAAHGTLGRYLCFVQEDWARGLPHLARSSDAGLADIARKELSKPFDPAARLDLAQSWATWAGKNKADENAAAWMRAHFWLAPARDETRPRPQGKSAGLEQAILAGLNESGSFIASWRGYRQSSGEVMRLAGHSSEVTSLAVARSGRWLVSGARDDTVRIWDLTTGTELSRLPSPIDDITTLALLPDEQTVVIGGLKPRVVTANLVTRAEVAGFDITSSVRKVAVSGDGRGMMCLLSQQPQGLFLSEISGSGITAFPVSTTVRAIDLARSGSFAVCGDDNNVVHVWDPRKPGASATLTGFTSYLSHVAISPGEQYIGACYSEGVVIWDARSLQEVARIAIPRAGQVFGFTLDSQRLVVASSTTEITVVDVAHGTALPAMTSEGDASTSTSCSALAIFSDGRGAATAGFSGVIHVWRLPD